MNARERFVTYVQKGGTPFASPQIGAGAGFDAKMTGKRWLGEVTLDDTLEVCQRFDMVPLLNTGPVGYEQGDNRLAWHTETLQNTDTRRTYRSTLDSPYGVMERITVEEPMKGSFMTKYPVQNKEDLDIQEWYFETLLESDFTYQTEHLARLVERIDGRAALSVQWGMQPYELLSFSTIIDAVFLCNDYPEQYLRMMEMMVVLDRKFFDCCAQAGVDFVLMGGPAAETLSPNIYHQYLIPYSKRVTDMAHDKGLLVYSHVCSPVEPFLTMGFFGQMGIDLFETLSPPPVGNLISLTDAFTKLPESMCTRGNIGLDVLLQETPEQIYKRSMAIMKESQGRKHILAASDYMFYGVPEENVRAMCDAARDFTNT